MSVQFRPYSNREDYERVDAFLITHHKPGNTDGNWIEPMWEYMHFHSLMDSNSLEKIGVWEENERIVAVVHYEWHLGEAFFQIDPAYQHLFPVLLDHAEHHLTGIRRDDGRKYLKAYVNDNAPDFQAVVKARGYVVDPEERRPMDAWAIPADFPAIKLPEGYCLTSLADEPDWLKLHRVLHRGFDHAGEPPMDEQSLAERRRMFETPKARMDLKIAVKARDGSFVSFCGMFYEPEGKFCYVEPVATDPDHRRLGLGKAGVLEGIRRCAALGAETAYVGNDLPVYQSVGFKIIYTSDAWVKYF